MSKRAKRNRFLLRGAVSSFLLHLSVVLLCAALISMRPEPGGSGLVLDAFLVGGGDGFYQQGVPWGDMGYVAGKKGERTEHKSSDPQKIDRKKSEKKQTKKKNPERKKAPSKKQSSKTVKKSKTAHLPKNQTKKTSKETAKKNPASLIVEKNKHERASEIPEKSSASALKSGEGGTGTQPYGGAVGDAPGYGAGAGTGIGIGRGSGVGDMEAARYFVKLRRLLQRRLKYPENISGARKSGKAVVRFYLSASGEIDKKSVVLAVSSGVPELDVQAVRTVAELPKLSEPPRGAMTIEIPVVFRVYH